MAKKIIKDISKNLNKTINNVVKESADDVSKIVSKAVNNTADDASKIITKTVNNVVDDIPKVHKVDMNKVFGGSTVPKVHKTDPSKFFSGNQKDIPTVKIPEAKKLYEPSSIPINESPLFSNVSSRGERFMDNMETVSNLRDKPNVNINANPKLERSVFGDKPPAPIEPPTPKAPPSGSGIDKANEKLNSQYEAIKNSSRYERMHDKDLFAQTREDSRYQTLEGLMFKDGKNVLNADKVNNPILDRMREKGLDPTKMSMEEFNSFRQKSVVGANRHDMTFGDQMVYHQAPQKGAAALGGVFVVNALTSSKGQQTNAQLYGQERYY